MGGEESEEIVTAFECRLRHSELYKRPWDWPHLLACHGEEGDIPGGMDCCEYCVFQVKKLREKEFEIWMPAVVSSREER